jgi:hypothetical protein
VHVQGNGEQEIKMSTDHSKMRLGKQPARHDPRTLQMANYLELPAVPAAKDWTSAAKAAWGMMKNDTLGDCTCAAVGHAVQGWSANAGGKEITISDVDIVAAYSAITGYKPSDPSSDRGAVEIDVLNYWRKHGIGGHKIQAYVALEPKNHDHVKAAVDLLGASYIGVALPVSAQKQKVWSVPPGGPNGIGAAGSWGGHAVVVLAYDSHGLTCITWGQPKKMTWSFWDTYCDESYGVLSPDWVSKHKPAPSGFDLLALEADLKELVG